MKDVTEDKKETIIFVYNADSGFLNALIDYAHKIISPKTCPCNLCAITYDNFGMKSDWKKFIKSLEVNVEFLHKDEFLKKYKKEGKFPSAFRKNKELKLFISQEEMKALKSLDEFIELIKKKL